MDTIAAISTPTGEGGIGIVRVSGPKALKIADTIFRGSTSPASPRRSRGRAGEGKIKPSSAKSHTIHFGKIIEPSANKVIDEVLLMIMRKPNTYTCEDMVEINTHGSMVSLKRILHLVIQKGARLAEPGEFTKLAFLSGRIDLAQAEAVLDVIQAKTDGELELAISQLDGAFSSNVKALKDKLLKAKSYLEVNIDFPEEELNVGARCIVPLLNDVQKVITSIIHSGEQGRVFKEGISFPIVGRTNVGKSSLFNTLLSFNRAIVTSHPGTTRDTIEEWIDIDGVPVKLIDTAGLDATPVHPVSKNRPCIRDNTTDFIDKSAQQRTRKAIDSAYGILFVFDVHDGITKEDIKILNSLKGKKVIPVLNKYDLPHTINYKLLTMNYISVSALTGYNIKAIPKAISDGINSANIPPLLLRIRHLEALKKSLNSVKKACRMISQVKLAQVELISYELQEAINSLSEITGEITNESILSRIFSEFCIGK